jgi:hypothetical protein
MSRIIVTPAGTTTASFATGIACDGQLSGLDHFTEDGGGGGGSVGVVFESMLHEASMAMGITAAVIARRRSGSSGMGILGGRHPRAMAPGRECPQDWIS